MSGVFNILKNSTRNVRFFLSFFSKELGEVTGNKKSWEGRGKKLYSQEKSKDIVNSPLGQIQVPNLLFHEVVTQNWSLWERKVAVVCGETGKRYTFKNLMDYSKALGSAFQNKLNLTKGDVIALVLYNCPEYPIVFLAASRSGIIPTTINPSYTAEEIKWQIKDSGAKLIITNASVYDKCFSIVQDMKASFPILVVKPTSNIEVPEGSIDLVELFDPFISGSPKPVDIHLDDTFALPYSSGTTGAPKGVVLTHRSVVSNLAQISHPDTVIMNPTTRFHQDRILGILPMFHIYGLMIITFYSLKDGCRLIILPKFNPYLFTKILYLKKIRIVYVVPPILMLLSNDAVKGKHLRHLEYIINAASPLTLPHAYKILEKAENVKIAQAYGMTESSPALTHTSPLRMQKLNSIGIPVASTQIKISHLESGKTLSMGEQGELRAWGPQMMKGYLNRPEETKNAFDEDGFLRTGDVAYYDEDGDFFIVDRLKDLIKVKGFQVAPAEIEEVLRTHPKIRDAAVVGIPDDEHGEVPRAFVIPKKGIALTEDEVKEFISKKVSSYKQLRGGVKFLDEFPKNNIGKVLRKELKKMS